MALVTAVAWVQSVDRELLPAMGVAKKPRKFDILVSKSVIIIPFIESFHEYKTQT